MKQIFSTIVNTVMWVVILGLLFLVASGLYQHYARPGAYTGFFGVGYAVVVTGSMEPGIRVNDLIVYQDVDPAYYREGDVAVYRQEREDGEILITHRLLEKGEDTWILKGDANQAADPPVPVEAVVGKVVLVVPKAGTAVRFLRSGVGLLAVIGSIAVLTLLSLLLFNGKTKRERVESVTGMTTVKY